MIAIYEQEKFFGIPDAKNFIRDFKQSCALYGQNSGNALLQSADGVLQVFK
jgi:hypothetical protein